MSVAYDGLVTYRRAGGAPGSALVPALAESLPRQCDLSDGIEVNARTRTVVIRLTEPDPELLHKLTLPFAYVLPAAQAHRSASAPPPPGTGPYRIASAGARGARLVRNRRFGAGSHASRPPGFADRIEVELGRTSGVDVLEQYAVPTATKLRALTTRYGGRLRVDTALETEYLFLNTTVPPFDDVRVRRALNLAIDRDRALEVSGGPAVGTTTCGMLPPGLPGHRPTCPFRQDLAAARRLVAASGTRGDAVTVWSPPATGPIARYLVSVLRELGYRGRLRPETNVERYFRLVADPRTRVQAGISLWVADYLASSNVIVALFSCGERGITNFSQLCDQRLESLIDRAVEAREPGEASARWDAVERRLGELAPTVPLFHTRTVNAHSERAGNLEVHPLWGPLLDQVWVR